ncbi:MAG: lipoprotein insertase outer membrane protein LolB [Arenimonas sp.]|nr:lipoprotein insertase outer membrane protein LolB [Arenimonas sp.]
MIRRLSLSLVLLFLAACAPVPVRTGGDADLLAAQSAREAVLREEAGWRLTGRLAVSAGGEGGSGRLDWRQQADGYDIQLAAPVTRKSWRLVSRAGQVRLEGLEGGTREGTDAEALLAEATGWDIPVAALADWARGARAPGPARIEFGPEGLPALIVQHGWTVEYRDWLPGDAPRPRRVFAAREGATVRLVVESWGQP